MKWNNQNRIEIKTLDDEDLDEMDDCEIEIEDDDVIPNAPSNSEFKELDVEEVIVDTDYIIVNSTPEKTPSKVENSNSKNNAKKKLTEEELVKEWQDEILPNFDKLKDTEMVKNMIMTQVPKKLRGSIWRVSSGNPASISQDYYQLLVWKGGRLADVVLKKVEIERAGQPEHDSEYLRTKIEYNMMVMKPGVSREDSVSIIENDLPRTFPTFDFYNQDTESGVNHINQLRRILRAFAVMRPDIGYVQGMSYLAAFLLLENDEFQTFVLFHNLLIKSQILTFYKFEADDIIQRLKFFRQAFLVEIPDLCEYFEEEKIDPRNYIYEWIMTIYTRALPINVTKKIWDLYFIDGFPWLFRAALAILKIQKEKLLYSDIEEVMKTLKGNCLVASEEQMMETISQVKLPEWVFEELKDL